MANWEDKRSAPLFGDGAGAVVLARASRDCGAIGPIVLGADGSQARRDRASRASRKLHMDGPEVYRHAVARMSESRSRRSQLAGLTLDDIDLFVYHQANARITRALGERLGLAAERVVDVIDDLGNSSAATLPLALAEAERDGRLRPGARVLLGAFGAGFTWGAGVIGGEAAAMAERGRLRAGDRRLARHRRGDRARAGRRRLGGGGQLPLRPDGAEAVVSEIEATAAAPLRSAPTWPTRTPPTSCSPSSRRISTRPCWCSSTTPASAATT